jgi:hypothetical protein
MENFTRANPVFIDEADQSLRYVAADGWVAEHHHPRLEIRLAQVRTHMHMMLYHCAGNVSIDGVAKGLVCEMVHDIQV